MEKYSIRTNLDRFCVELEICKTLIETFHKYNRQSFDKEYNLLLDLQKRFLHMSDMCKQQNLNLIGKTNPHIALGACANLISTVKQEYFDNSGSDSINLLLDKVLLIIETITNNTRTKINTLVEIREPEPEELVQQAEEETVVAPNGSFKSFTDAAKKLLADNFKEQEPVEPVKDTESRFYDKLNSRLAAEKSQIELDLDDLNSNCLKLVRGSVSVHHFFTPDLIKNIDHSIISFKGISFNRQNRETIPPIHVFHNQLLIAMTPKAQKFTFRTTSLTGEENSKRKEKKFRELSEQAASTVFYQEGVMIDFTNRFNTNYLVAKAFPGVRFLWFITPVMETIFGQVKEGATALLWE